MNINRFVVFVSVAKTGSISAAAEALYMTQPAVSQSIHALEKELGISLIIRRAAGIELTKAGKKLANEAEILVQDYDHFMQEAQRLKNEPTGLKVYYTGKLEREFIAGAISLDESNRLNLSLSYGTFAEVESRLETGDADIVFSMPSVFAKKWNTVTLLKTPMKIVAKRGTFQTPSIFMEELKKHRIAVLDKQVGGIAGIEFRKKLFSLGFSPENLISTDSIESQMLLVESGKAVTIMPCVDKGLETVELIDLADTPILLETVCAYRQETPEIRVLIELCRKVAGMMK